MKKIEAYIRDHKFEEVKNALVKAGVSGITAYQVMGRGNQIGKGMTDSESGIILEDTLIPKRKIEIFLYRRGIRQDFRNNHDKSNYWKSW